MSKIEEALKKARAEGKTSAVSSDRKNELEKSPVISGVGKNLVKQNSSSLIKLMKKDAVISSEMLTDKGIIQPDLKRTKVTDSFRHLRTQLLQKSKNENFIVLVTSCAEGIDSAFVAMNMGVAFAFDETKTSLVIDCDIRTHMLDKMLSDNFETGLLDFLDHSLEVSEIIKDIGVERLRVIPSGKKPVFQSEYFTSDRMRALLDGLVERYHDRYVVINSPPVSESADTSILIGLVDYVIVVVPYGQVAMSSVKEAINKIDKTKLLGVVLNDVPDWT